jgi:hypothetical protein
MLKEFDSRVLASLPGTVKRGSAAELRPCLGQGTLQDEESVLADSGREGEITAGVGRVRKLGIVSILQGRFLITSDMLVVDFKITQNGFSGTC